MACFLAPVAEAIVVSAIKKNVEHKEAAACRQAAEDAPAETAAATAAIPFSRKLGWLSKMLWGGSFLLAIEHIWHGEVVPWPPFLTAMNNPADIQPMLTEILAVGGAMMVVVTAAWLLMLLAVKRLENKAAQTPLAAGGEG
ncbi:MAG: hypothetical protein K6B40_08005 [Firmicutes bacterium]|nr:hypothetical protein [Bacillota bacterium]